jgi:hypothetical protein
MLDVYKYHSDPESLDNYYVDHWWVNVQRALKHYIDVENDKLETERTILCNLHKKSISIFDRTKGTMYRGMLEKINDTIQCKDFDGQEYTSFAYDLTYDELLDNLQDYVHDIVFKGDE